MCVKRKLKPEDCINASGVQCSFKVTQSLQKEHKKVQPGAYADTRAADGNGNETAAETSASELIQCAVAGGGAPSEAETAHRAHPRARGGPRHHAVPTPCRGSNCCTSSRWSTS